MAQLTWLITGCSSGLGEAFARELLSRGEKVIATARSSSRLAELREAGAAVLDLDVTAPQADIKSKIQQAIQIYGGIDVLVNNAGFFEWALVEETSNEQYLSQINTNLLGTIVVTQAILPHFRERSVGKLVFIGSKNGWRGYAGIGAYAISKFALEGFIESLDDEVARLGIQSIIFEPGQFRTPVLSSSSRKASSLSADPDYKDLSEEIGKDLQDSNGAQNGDPQKGVSRMIDVVKGEGMAEGRKMPLRMPIGPDSLRAVREKCEETLRICGEWEDLIGSTDFDEEVAGGASGV